MISFWSSTGTEHAASLTGSSSNNNINPVRPHNFGPSPTPSPRPSSTSNKPLGLNHSSLAQFREISQTPSAESGQMNQLKEMVRDLKKLLNEKIAAYEILNQQTEKLLEENQLLKEQVQAFSLSLDSNEEIDSIGI
jgi:hypothetical protein